MKRLFPLFYYLYILQISEYNLGKFSKWYLSNWANREFVTRKTLVWTSKAKLLFLLSVLLIACASLVLTLAFFRNWLILILMFIVFEQLAGVFLAAAALLVKPLENLVKFYIVKSAAAKIAKMPNLKVVGITGSAGKTSTKEFLATILSQNYKVVKTPKSYNTALGLSKTINNMPNDTEIFIAEMGAYRRGEIKKLTDFVRPQIGILTHINEQHLATFGNLSNIIRGKYELIESLPRGGVAIFNLDNKYCRALAEKTKKVKVVGYSAKNSQADVVAVNVRLSKDDNHFGLKIAGKTVDISTSLLGIHNVSNLLGAASAAYELGLTPVEIAKGVGQIIPLPHRLQIVSTDNDITIIDDSYNVNPEGAMAALDVLKLFGTSRKILVTSGMVELGKREEQYNIAFGRKAAAVCDWLIAIGSRGKLVAEGLARAGFDSDRQIVCDSMVEAREFLDKILIPPAVVIFQTELPEIY